ncbi:FMN-binding negative transcriptional regulator [Rudaea sp.]|uniref:FMN-binding negative transcriptional regulator n=1 Tax=Rudaea sp. TaxID=2136325 RepID=UPI00321FCCBD
MTTNRFSPRNDADVADLVTRHPLAFVVSHGGDRVHSTPLPMRIEHVDDGRIATLTGHIARANPQVAALQVDPRATLLFRGPQGYVSPSWFNDRTQAPTWNYVVANFAVRIDFLDDTASLERIVRDLVDAMEAGRKRAWSVDDMGTRYAQLASRIVAFRATVTAIEAKFKLGQDERDDIYPEIIAGLRNEGDQDALIAMMQEFNAQRDAGKSP